jgi:hypothetical protein
MPESSFPKQTFELTVFPGDAYSRIPAAARVMTRALSDTWFAEMSLRVLPLSR